MAENKKIPTGMAIDPTGGPVIDPTANVIALTEAANRRQDDLRELNDKLNELRNACAREIGDLRAAHIKQVGEIREDHQAQLRLAESARLDAIRQVDREDVTKTAAQVLSAVQTLAQMNNTTAETLRTQVASTAAAASTAFATAMQETNKRLSALELSSSEGKGRAFLADPQMAELLVEMKNLRGSRDTQQGGGLALHNLWGYLIAAVLAGVAIMNYLK